MTNIQDQLAKVPMFRDLNKKTLERLERIARERSFKDGDVIVKEGDEGVGFYLISSGSVDVSRGGAHIATLQTGQFFGEMALLDNYRRSATVTAKGAVQCLAMLRSDFTAELRGNSEIAIEMLTMMSRRLRETDEQLAHS